MALESVMRPLLYKKEIILILSGTIMAFSTSVLSTFLTNRLFFEREHLKTIERMLNEKSYPLPDSTNPNVTIKMPESAWTWGSVAFYALLPSLFCFAFGRVVRIAKVKRKWIVCVVPPVLTAVAFVDILLPLYLLFCYLGVRLRSRESDQAK